MGDARALAEAPVSDTSAQTAALNGLITTNSSEKSEKGNLTLPIIPILHPDFSVDVSYDDRNRPKGVELVSSLATSIFLSWRDTANQRIATPISDHPRPFPRFHYTIQPSTVLGADLTPLKVGLATCHMLSGVLRRDPWPGRINARITDSTILPRRQSVAIGYMEVANSPLPGLINDDAAAVIAPANNSRSTIHIDRTGLSIPSIVEKRWLVCFTRFILFAFQHPASGSVTDDPVMSPEPLKYTYKSPCGPGRDELIITMYPEANAHSAWRLSWVRLVSAMLVWIVEVATQGEHRYLEQKVIKEGGVLQAILSISVDPLTSDKSDNAVMPA
ncbi:MAG: hypothetical protein Q9224_005333 [Gallowayella concinna]